MIKYINGKPPPIIIIRDYLRNYLRSIVTGLGNYSYQAPKSLQFVHLVEKYNKKFITFLYCIINGFISIAIMGGIAMWSKNPFVFPSLGPTAFLFFFSPTAPASSPRNTFMGHSLGIFAGWFSLLIFGLLDDPNVLVSGFTWQRVLAAGLSLGLTCGLMAVFTCPHPPAGATTLIVSLGLVHSYFGFFCMILAVMLLNIQALIINRAAGIDYPIWKPWEGWGHFWKAKQ